MKYLFLLSGENIGLAVDEAVAVVGRNASVIAKNLLVFNKASGIERLAFTKAVFRLLFVCDLKELRGRLELFAWNRIYTDNFAVRVVKSAKSKFKLSEKELAGLIWNRLKKPVVNLENPKTGICIFLIGQKAYVCILVSELKHDFESRKPRFRPGFSPVSLHPKLARVLVNLSGAKKGVVCDPFCGTGGILIEAGLMGLKPVGYDLDEKMIGKSEVNLKHSGINDFVLVQQDSTKIRVKYDYIVTDLPYGQSSYLMANLYADFLAALAKILGKRAVVVFPSKMSYRKLVRDANLEIISENSYYIHRSLSKKILVLQRKH